MNILNAKQKIMILTSKEVSQTDMANVLGVTRQTINKRIKTNSNLSKEEIEKLNKFYNVNLTLSENRTVEELAAYKAIADSAIEYVNLMERAEAGDDEAAKLAIIAFKKVKENLRNPAIPPVDTESEEYKKISAEIAQIKKEVEELKKKAN